MREDRVSNPTNTVSNLTDGKWLYQDNVLSSTQGRVQDCCSRSRESSYQNIQEYSYTA
jgi:hypothetical protein